MSRRSLRVSEKKINVAKAATILTQQQLADDLKLSRSTVSNFFLGKPIDHHNFRNICEYLGLNWETMADITPDLSCETAIEATVIAPDSYNRVDKSQIDNLAQTIDWREICRNMLEGYKEVTTNDIMPSASMHFGLDDIYVPLGLVERKEKNKYEEDIEPEQGSRLYEPSYRTAEQFQGNDFFDRVLQSEDIKKIAIIGEPGAGKTTLLQKISFWILKKRLGFPIWVNLGELDGKSLQEYLINTWLNQAVARLTEEIRNDFIDQVAAGKIWFLLDGMDEMLTRQDTASLRWLKNQLRGWIGHSRFILTCRLNIWESDINFLSSFKAYRTLPFTFRKVEKFIKRWFKIDNPSLGISLIKELEGGQRRRLSDLAKNPLRLAMLCSIWHGESGDLPQTKFQLYQEFVNKFYVWKRYIFDTSRIDKLDLNTALGNLAKKAISERSSRFRIPYKMILESLGEPENKQSCAYLALELGWLNRVGLSVESKEPVYAFFHPTFQEYFAATSIDSWKFFFDHIPEDPSRGVYKIFEPQWREVILLWLGRDEMSNVLTRERQKQEFIDALVKFRDECGEFYQYQAYLIALIGIFEFKEYRSEEEVLQTVIRWAFGSENKNHNWEYSYSVIEEASLKTLEESNNHRVAFRLSSLLGNSEDHLTRVKAAKSLAKIIPGNKYAIRELIDLLEIDEISDKVVKSFEEVGLKNRDVIDALIKKIRQQNNWKECEALIQVLEKIAIGDSYTEALLVEVLEEEMAEDEKDFNEIFSVAVSLDKIYPGHDTARQALSLILDESKQPYQCIRAARKLGQMELDKKIAIENLIKLFRESTASEFRRQVIQALGEIGHDSPEAISLLIQIFSSDTDEYREKNPDMHRRAVSSLGKIAKNNQEAIIAITSLMHSSQHEVTCVEACKALLQINSSNKDALKFLKKRLNTKDNEHIRVEMNEHIRVEMAELLYSYELSSETALEVLKQLLEISKNKSVLLSASQALIRFEPIYEKSWNTLRSLINESPPRASIPAVNALVAAIKDEQQTQLCIQCLRDRWTKEDQADFENYDDFLYSALWEVAQTTSYPVFYNSWNL